MMIRGKGTLRPIPSDPAMERMDKNTAGYKYKLKRLQCIICPERATQMMCYDVDGAMLVERYCNACLSKLSNQSTSGI
jgi:hypothetical protein